MLFGPIIYHTPVFDFFCSHKPSRLGCSNNVLSDSNNSIIACKLTCMQKLWCLDKITLSHCYCAGSTEKE